MRCSKCNVRVLDTRGICPLCGMVLEEESKESEAVSGYPDVVHRLKKRDRALRIVLIMLIGAGFVCGLVNYLTYDRLSYPWAVIAIGAAVYGFYTLWDLLGHDGDHLSRIYHQVFALTALLVFLDYMTGSHGIVMGYGIPVMVFVMVAAMLLCICLNRRNWPIYMGIQLLTALYGLVGFVLAATGVTGMKILNLVAFALALIVWFATILLGDRRASNELKRKFHV